MTANKHTPGPWHMDPEEVTGGFRIVPKIGDRGLAVAIQRDAAPAIPGSGIDRATAEANARLIAAAPELLEALERIARPHDCGCKPCTSTCRNQIALEIAAEEMQDVARAAIAKATGSAA